MFLLLCSICRGPDWRPGIFVQFTKEAGPARDAGLRPGDQLLQCNGTPFTDIPFSEVSGNPEQRQEHETRALLLRSKWDVCPVL